MPVPTVTSMDRPEVSRGRAQSVSPDDRDVEARVACNAIGCPGRVVPPPLEPAGSVPTTVPPAIRAGGW
jgi:hypothetical protein